MDRWVDNHTAGDGISTLHMLLCGGRAPRAPTGGENMEEEPEALVKRLRDLEMSQAKIREQLGMVVREGGAEPQHQLCKTATGGEEAGQMPGFFARNPYRNVLQCMGHALHICRPGTGEIIYWNQSAENLYGWKNCEALGQRVADLLVDEENRPYLKRAMERLSNGQSWSGQFPFKKRSGEKFVALVTQSPLYEDGEFIGIITVSSDATILHDKHLETSRVNWDQAQSEPRDRIQWRPKPQIASSLSGLALKAIFRSHAGKRAVKEITFKYGETVSKFNHPSKIGSNALLKAAKVFGKPNVRGSTYQFQEADKGIQTNSSKNSASNSTKRVHRPLDEAKSQNMKIAECCSSNFSIGLKEKVLSQTNHGSDKREGCFASSSSIKEMRTGFPRGKEVNDVEQSRKKDDVMHERQSSKQELTAHAIRQRTDALQKKEEDKHSSTSTTLEECPGGNQTSSSTTGVKDLNSVIDCYIQWQDLLLGEEIGEGSYAVVHRGVWNGSDVAIKVYLRKDYQEGALLDFKKEIAIMKRLRHPNVLLFMGAVYSPDRLAIVTEFLPRGSLFRTLHKSSQALDLKRRLKMALDVAKGMNYLHRRNPPIIHRDLKSSNLLVDKTWTVKVGDFGLSCLKSSSVLTTKSGKGTPQWMAPEVLRGESLNEMSDVFSFGVILWELMTECVPWSHLDSLQVVGVVGFMDRRLDLPEGLDPRVASIISNCWESDPERRPSFQEIVGRIAELTGAVVSAPAHRRSEHPTGGRPSAR